MVILPVSMYEQVEGLLERVPINTLFAQSVLRGQMKGTVYADHAEDPRVFYIVHPYGMSLLFGDTEDGAFNTAFIAYLLNADKSRQNHEWMQVYPGEWAEHLEMLLGDNLIKTPEKDGDPGKVAEYTRVNFAFDPQKYRGRGFAYHACAALIEYCIRKGLMPVWSCRYENTASYRLAQRLGFVPTLYLPYYRLAV